MLSNLRTVAIIDAQPSKAVKLRRSSTQNAGKHNRFAVGQRATLSLFCQKSVDGGSISILTCRLA